MVLSLLRFDDQSLLALEGNDHKPSLISSDPLDRCLSMPNSIFSSFLRSTGISNKTTRNSKSENAKTLT